MKSESTEIIYKGPQINWSQVIQMLDDAYNSYVAIGVREEFLAEDRKLIDKVKQIQNCQTEIFEQDVLMLMPNLAKGKRDENKGREIEFLDWVNHSGYESVYSKALDMIAWVDTNSHPIYQNGSDYHYTELVKNYGKTTDAIYNEFLKSKAK